MIYLIRAELPRILIEELTLYTQNFNLKSKGDFHITLMWGDFYDEREKEIINALESIKIDPFEIQTSDFDTFSEGSLVTLVRSDKLIGLHELIKMNIKRFEKPDSPYHLGPYQPHITLGKIQEGLDFNLLDNPLLGNVWPVNKFTLNKKNKGFIRIKEFDLRY